ncbi:MAG TPA: hypothetical protein EYN66_12680 [Myxococcales bacterium]|nr:hypothetical protein [Myxococcales bacterium]
MQVETYSLEGVANTGFHTKGMIENCRAVQGDDIGGAANAHIHIQVTAQNKLSTQRSIGTHGGFAAQMKHAARTRLVALAKEFAMRICGDGKGAWNMHIKPQTNKQPPPFLAQRKAQAGQGAHAAHRPKQVSISILKARKHVDLRKHAQALSELPFAGNPHTKTMKEAARWVF